MSMDLHNNHNVYILGAGFSRDAGLPLISDFLVRMRDSHDWLMAQGRKHEAESVAEVLRFRLNAASAAYWVKLDLENIEELFSLASASDNTISDHIRVAVAATLDYAQSNNSSKLQVALSLTSSGGDHLKRSRELLERFMTLEEQLGSPPTYFRCFTYRYYLARLMGMLCNFKPQGENTFITFNYDTLVEDSLAGLGLGVDYGGGLKGWPLMPNSIRVPVYKLHGSVNWSRDSGGKLLVHNGYSDLYSKKLIPEIIPPTWKKVFENQIETIWSEAIEKLSTATRIIIIGFSMPPTDMHFKYLLAAGLGRNLSLREVVFVNNNSKPIEDRARQLLRDSYIDDSRIKFCNSDLMSFCSSRNGYDGRCGLHELGRREAGFLQYSFNWS